jgi:ADP-ribose pyrophosphatase
MMLPAVEWEWERLDREVVFTGRVVAVHRDRVRIARDGETREAVYDVVHHPGAVAIVALFEDGQVALLRQFRYAVGGTIWEIPAGTLEPGESPRACAERELVEEIGFRARSWKPLVDFYTSPGFCDETMSVFLAEDLVEAESAPEADEHLEVLRLPLEEAIGWVGTGRIRDAKTVIGLHAVRALLESEGRWSHGSP